LGNILLQRVAHQRPATTKGALGAVHADVQGLAHNQIWEDPIVDLEALQLHPTTG
jgi:S-adenosylmethionine:diacylglycerol 3-amino-3-carboxypropyl transferase